MEGALFSHLEGGGQLSQKTVYVTVGTELLFSMHCHAIYESITEIEN